MATMSLEQVVNSLLTPEDEPAIHADIISDNPLNLCRMDDMMRDVPMRTIGDVVLWTMAAQAVGDYVKGTYDFTVMNGRFHNRDISLWDVHKVTIYGICATVVVKFAGLHVMSVEHDGEKIFCDTIEFHKGDFLLSLNGKDAGIISGVW